MKHCPVKGAELRGQNTTGMQNVENLFITISPPQN